MSSTPMMTTQDEMLIRQQVEQQLPGIAELSTPELEAYAGDLAFAMQGIHFAVPPSAEMRQREGEAFVKTHRGLRDVVCGNQTLLTGGLDVATVTSVIAAIAPLVGFPPAAVPAGAIAVAVLLIKLGISEYCRAYQPATS